MDITIYSTADCAACHALTDWLDAKGQSYTKKITDTDDRAMAEFMKVNDGLIAVPFTVIALPDGQVVKISGFDRARFQQVLHI